MEPIEHKKAKELFYHVAKKEIEIMISEGIIMECYFVLLKFYKDKDKIIDKLEKILKNEKCFL